MPHAPTPLQSEASRRNGSLSRGPVGEAGKAASAQNAERHGLRGGGIRVRPEESAWYAALLTSHLELYAPCDAAERAVVEQLCVVELKLARLDRLELAVLDPAAEGERERAVTLPSLATLVRYRSRIAKERWELEHRLSQLRHRRESQGAQAAGVRQERSYGARASAFDHRGTMDLLRGGGLPERGRSGTNEPEPPGRRECTNEPEAAGAGRPLNRRQRRLLARLARREALPARAAAAA